MKNTLVECLYDCFIINIIIKVRLNQSTFLFDAFVDFSKSAYVIIRLENEGKTERNKLSEKGREKEIK